MIYRKFPRGSEETSLLGMGCMRLPRVGDSESVDFPEAEKLLDEVGITVNKNAIPFDTQKPFVTSGVRIGTPATTSRGFKEEDMIEVGKLIALTIKDFENSQDEVRKRVAALCAKYPLYE